MAGMLEYKCPCCDGAIKFDSTTQKMKCPYCDTEFEVDALKGYDEDLKDAKPSRMNWTTPGGGWAEGETAGLHTYACKSCGGEIVGDDTMAASACPFCGNPIVLTGQFAGDLRPDLIIPFKLDKKAAKAKLQEHLKGKTLLPKVFRSQNHIDEIKGVYVPFWLYDSDADAQLRFTATRTRCWSDDDYDYTETSYYSVRRDGVLGFDAVPVDGSSKMADDLMESIEPFAMQDAVAFNTAYLAGYVADKYDVDAKKSIERANKRIRRSTEDAFTQTVTGYDSVKVENSSIQLHGSKAKYALFPVWVLSTSWRGNNYIFAMNGQTGKFVGDLPVDKAAARKWTLGLTAAVGPMRSCGCCGWQGFCKGGTEDEKHCYPTALPLCCAGRTGAFAGAGCTGLCRRRLCRPVLPYERQRGSSDRGRGQRAGSFVGGAERPPEL